MTLSVAGIFKEIATIMLSSTVFGDELTPINVTGLCVALTGIGLYNYLKYKLMIKNNLGQQGSSRVATDEESCTEMGGTILPSGRGAGVGGIGNDVYTRLSRDETQVEMEGQGVELTKEELERRRRREEEADMAGWQQSGISRTGNGYDDGSSNSSSDGNSHERTA
jgi:solute carrier family 35 protein C2